jgi:hypothetical protein
LRRPPIERKLLAPVLNTVDRSPGFRQRLEGLMSAAAQYLDGAVADPEQFKQIAKGDQVEATYTQALALSVQGGK